MNKSVLLLLTSLSLITSFKAFSKDYGVRGKTFQIQEENILTAIKDSITPEKVEEFQQTFKKEAIKSINRPTGINLPRATEFKQYFTTRLLYLNQI